MCIRDRGYPSRNPRFRLRVSNRSLRARYFLDLGIQRDGLLQSAAHRFEDSLEAVMHSVATPQPDMQRDSRLVCQGLEEFSRQGGLEVPEGLLLDLDYVR